MVNGSRAAAVNQTNSRWEQIVDNVMTGIDTKVGRFEAYVKSPEGRYTIEKVQVIATYAAALILALYSPFTVVAAIGVGVVVKAFSPEQLDNVQKAISRIGAVLPLSVKALATVFALTYTPIAFPILGGLCAGFELGSRVSPYLLVNGIESASSIVSQKESGKPGSAKKPV